VKAFIQNWLDRILIRENLYALLFCLILIALVILSSDQAPQWIYQGF
jgi:hypothetical protein